MKLDNYGWPIINDEIFLASFIGMITKRPHFAPISYKKWCDILSTYKKEIQ